MSRKNRIFAERFLCFSDDWMLLVFLVVDDQSFLRTDPLETANNVSKPVSNNGSEVGRGTTLMVPPAILMSRPERIVIVPDDGNEGL